jgi:putative glutamine amidotransferase
VARFTRNLQPKSPHPPLKGPPEELLALRHPVTIDPGSRLGTIYGVDRRDVNTLHHQAPALVSTDLVVTSRSADGHVEALEYAGDWYAVAVQWHPERLNPGDEAPLFEDFTVHASRFRRA